MDKLDKDVTTESTLKVKEPSNQISFTLETREKKANTFDVSVAKDNAGDLVIELDGQIIFCLDPQSLECYIWTDWLRAKGFTINK